MQVTEIYYLIIHLFIFLLKISQWMTIYTLLYQGFSTLVKELTIAIRVRPSASNELSTLVSGNAKCKRTNANT